MRISQLLFALALVGGCSQETCDHSKKAVDSAGRDLEKDVDVAKRKTQEAVDEMRTNDPEPERDDTTHTSTSR